MKDKYTRESQRASSKSENKFILEQELPVEQWMSAMRDEIEIFSAELGLKVMRAVMNEEISKRLGPYGQQSHYRHGEQPGYVIYGGRKVQLERPRMRRRRSGEEARLRSYEAFQQDGKLQRSVARQMMRQCSTRNYEGALDNCLEGYGIKKSSVSRQWKRGPRRRNWRDYAAVRCPKIWRH